MNVTHRWTSLSSELKKAERFYRQETLDSIMNDWNVQWSILWTTLSIILVISELFFSSDSIREKVKEDCFTLSCSICPANLRLYLCRLNCQSSFLIIVTAMVKNPIEMPEAISINIVSVTSDIISTQPSLPSPNNQQNRSSRHEAPRSSRNLCR